MEKSSKRGKIPQNDWPSIISRYESGETLASIARTYDCSPPAISYIISRTRARSLAGETSTAKADAVPAGELQLVKAGSAAISNDIADGELMHSDDPPEEEGKRPGAQTANIPQSADKRSADPPSRSAEPHAMPKDDEPLRRADDRAADTRRAAVGAGAGDAGSRPSGDTDTVQPMGEVRRTLHLSLPQGNGAAAPTAAQTPTDFGHAAGGRPNAGQAAQSELVLQPRQPLPPAPAGIRGPVAVGGPPDKPREAAFIDHALRERISDDIAAFLKAFDAALEHDTAESRTGLREATDRLLRAGARTRIELERLEARQPLPARDTGQRAFPSPRLR